MACTAKRFRLQGLMVAAWIIIAVCQLLLHIWEMASLAALQNPMAAAQASMLSKTQAEKLDMLLEQAGLYTQFLTEQMDDIVTRLPDAEAPEAEEGMHSPIWLDSSHDCSELRGCDREGAAAN